MSEPQITHSAEPTADLRGTIQAVLERHEDYHFSRIEPMANICNGCGYEWPCDAHTLATALLEAVTALECGRRYAETVVSQSEFFGMMSDIGIDAAYSIQEIDKAFIAIAAKLNGADDAR